MNTPEPGTSLTRLYLAAVVLAVLAVPALAVDLPFARICADSGLPGDLRKGLNLMEAYAHGVGVGLICLTVFVLDRNHRRYLWRFIACPLFGGLMGHLAKGLIVRRRPSGFDLSLTVTETFGQWFPFLTIPDWGHPLKSFPSGHSATAAGLTVALIWLYPQGRSLFITFAVLAALQRVGASAHYLSDTLAGAAVGLFFATLVCDPRFGGKIYDRLEREPTEK